jgi:hypothetical protein
MAAKKPEFEENLGVPIGLNHLALLTASAELARRETNKQVETNESDLRLLGACLCTLYQAATCHRGCNKGPHLLESLCARAYNQVCAAYHLLTAGYYDESLSLVRGIGEIYRFVALSTVDRARFPAGSRLTGRPEFGSSAQVKSGLDSETSRLSSNSRNKIGIPTYPSATLMCIQAFRLASITPSGLLQVASFSKRGSI